MAKYKVYFRCDITTPKSGGGMRLYKKDTKYNINEDLYNAVGHCCDVLKIKEDNDDWENALAKIINWYDDISKGIKRNYQVNWS